MFHRLRFSGLSIAQSVLLLACFLSPFTLSAHAACPQPPSGLISWWQAEGNANDFMSTNTGLMENGATFAPGRYGQAFSLNGSSSYIQLTDNGSLSPSYVTFGAWINVSSLPDPGGIIFDNLSGEPWYGYQLYISRDMKLVAQLYADTQQELFGNTVLQTGIWYYVSMTYDGSIFKTFVNGLPDASMPLTGPINYSKSVNPVIGSRWTLLGGYFPGLIDEVSIFNRALSQQEIYSTFVSGMSGICLDLIPEQFTFIDNTNAAVNSAVVSDPVTVTGIDGATPVSISNCTGTLCEYAISIDGGLTWGAWTPSAGMVNLNDQVKLKVTTSNAIATSTVRLSIGVIWADFKVSVPGYSVSGTLSPASKGSIVCPLTPVAKGADASCTVAASTAGWYIEQVVDGGTTISLVAHPTSYQYDLFNVLSAHTVHATLNEFLVQGIAGQAAFYYDQPDAAYADIQGPHDQILLRAWPGIYNPVTLNHGTPLFLGGGYSSGFVPNAANFSTLATPLIIAGGPVVLEGIAIQ